LKVYTNGNSASRERVMALGADRYLDYREEDYLEVLEPVDYVLDSLGGKELDRQMKLLRRGGKIVSLKGMPNGRFAQRFGLPTWKRWLFALAAFGVERKAKQQGITYEFLFVQSNGRQLAEVARLIAEKGIQPSVGQVFPFAETNEALQKVASGGAAGKVVLSFA
ncbi:MAG: zinc-binding dehydrogenase, partial [Prevotellaceae bacterium]|nr:zinc-binding dehydrogenase [Prevotellaceae bacterium]